ncbi:MAG: hypothetical protein ACRDQW_19000 [Haloechinothrix sp.]
MDEHDPSRPAATLRPQLTDLELLHRFVGGVLANGGRNTTIEECLAEFRDYLRELERLREEIRPAYEQSLRGVESKPLDIEDIKRRGREWLAGREIIDRDHPKALG